MLREMIMDPKELSQIDSKVVSMIEFDGQLIIATEYEVLRLIKEEDGSAQLVPIKMIRKWI